MSFDVIYTEEYIFSAGANLYQILWIVCFWFVLKTKRVEGQLSIVLFRPDMP